MSRLDAIQKRRESAGGSYDGYWYVAKDKMEQLGIERWSPEEGANFIAIIPPKDANTYWAKEIHVHYDVGVNKSAFICPRQFGEKCPICDERDRLKEQGANAEEISCYNWNRSFLYFLADVKNEATIEKGMRYAFLAKTIDEEILNLSRDDRTGQDFDISDPKTGCNIIFRRAGTGMTTKYSGFKKEDRNYELPKEWLEAVPDFDDALLTYDYETIYEELHGVNSESEETTTQRPTPSAAAQQSSPDSEPVQDSTPTESTPQSDGIEALKARLAANRKK